MDESLAKKIDAAIKLLQSNCNHTAFVVHVKNLSLKLRT